MGDVDKAAVAQAENVSDKPRKRGCLGHLARFWWAYLIVLVVIVVIVVPVVLLVGVPKIAQNKLDDAELILDGIVVTNTQGQNFSMSINSTIKSDGSVHAKIDGFQGVMYLEDHEPHTPFAKIDFPETTSDALQTVNVTQFVPIENLEALTRFNTWLLVNDSLRVTVEGDTHVHVRGISRSYAVTFKKTITIPGLRGLNGTVVKPTWVSLKPDEKGNNFRATTVIPNRSPVSFELGNVTFHNYLLGREVGTVFIDNLTLRPGTNEYPLRATIDNGAVIDALGQKPYCEQNGVLPFQIRGKTVVNHGQSLPYFADALAAYNQTVSIPIGEAVKSSLGVTVPCGGLGGGNN
ncbi:hypothetical protein MYCTH_2297089 [Thermothelomyces thermophilus ATCC 42464]|uniref:Uncharacterized protein n=1 Tax=Thermothelomyces thermophilus (strain ATCC 42464 / BCRC 31852 / DSM 1799) TaxID=573729 RepID=G2Q481_THET4|nr:uncharacterized protein MYCTH_2297089 [Thermothelomyces thermophilus ATCC 42464]AEO54476.1 hypothetical protein MYCTH_2297089 [Thermothelomyces thermophilus ATCC 42464]